MGLVTNYHTERLLLVLLIFFRFFPAFSDLMALPVSLTQTFDLYIVSANPFENEHLYAALAVESRALEVRTGKCAVSYTMKKLWFL